MVLKLIQINKSPNLELEFEGAFVEEEVVVEEEVHSVETMTNEGKGYTDHDKVECGIHNNQGYALQECPIIFPSM